MDTQLFTERILALEDKFRRERRHILLLLDNFKCHEVDLDLTHLFLPPRTTSKSQPMEQGIIHNLEQLYKKKLVEHYWSEAKSGQVKEINLLQAIRFLRESWDQVKQETVFKCFKKCLPNVRLAIDPEAQDDGASTREEVFVDPLIVHQSFPSGYTFADFVEAVHSLLTRDDFDPDGGR